jgi:hypothetical protein
MAETESSGGSAGVVAIFAIVMLVLIAGFFAWRAGIFGGGNSHHSIDINVNTPANK